MVLKELWDLYWCPMRLSVRQKVKLALLLGYLAHAEQKDAKYDDCEAGILMPRVETLPENYIGSNRLKYRRNAVPHPVHPEDIGIFEASDEEEDDPAISEETTAKVAELVAACKELQLKVTEYFGDAKQYEIQHDTVAHSY
jgi:hypothetical protein